MPPASLQSAALAEVRQNQLRTHLHTPITTLRVAYLICWMHVQAGEAVAFFVGKNGSGEGVDAFVTSALTAGFGSGGEAAQIEVLQRIFQVCLPKRPRMQGPAGMQGATHEAKPSCCSILFH